MAIQHNYAGEAKITYNSVDLGYTTDGVQLLIEPKYADVYSDRYGGRKGVPSDSQLVGATARIMTNLSLFERSACEVLTSFMPGGTAGTLPAIGTLLRQESGTASLVIDGVNWDYTFATAFPRFSVEMNLGSIATEWALGFEAWLNASTTRIFMTVTNPA